MVIWKELLGNVLKRDKGGEVRRSIVTRDPTRTKGSCQEISLSRTFVNMKLVYRYDYEFKILNTTFAIDSLFGVICQSVNLTIYWYSVNTPESTNEDAGRKS